MTRKTAFVNLSNWQGEDTYLAITNIHTGETRTVCLRPGENYKMTDQSSVDVRIRQVSKGEPAPVYAKSDGQEARNEQLAPALLVGWRKLSHYDGEGDAQVWHGADNASFMSTHSEEIQRDLWPDGDPENTAG